MTQPDILYISDRNISLDMPEIKYTYDQKQNKDVTKYNLKKIFDYKDYVNPDYRNFNFKQNNIPDEFRARDKLLADHGRNNDINNVPISKLFIEVDKLGTRNYM